MVWDIYMDSTWQLLRISIVEFPFKNSQFIMYLWFYLPPWQKANGWFLCNPVGSLASESSVQMPSTACSCFPTFQSAETILKTPRRQIFGQMKVFATLSIAQFKGCFLVAIKRLHLLYTYISIIYIVYTHFQQNLPKSRTYPNSGSSIVLLTTKGFPIWHVLLP